jgi:predicted O-methyltransferase YrrM
VTATRPMSPLVRLYQPDERFEISEAGLAEWSKSKTFGRIVSFYHEYPLQSLISNESRALLHHLVMMRRPKRILEIGTFVLGTTEVFARASWEAGVGHIDTIDPFGGERCPPILAAFPPELRDRVTFTAVNSGSHFDKEIAHNRPYDFVFIDGNHEFEYALFDLLCTARLISPRGLVVLDNVDQPGPRLATKTFLQHFPDWNDVAKVVGKIDPAAPFAPPTPSLQYTNFFLLEAPSYYAVGPEPRSFGSVPVDRAEVDGIELELAEAPTAGQLHMHVYARTFGLPEPEETQCRQTVAFDRLAPTSEGRVRIPLDKALRSAFDDPQLGRRVEIALAFTGLKRLALASPPLPYPAKHIVV